MKVLGLQRRLRIGFDETLERLPAALRLEGFGVLTQIDVAATLKEKLGADFRRYRILGACNPPLAHRALSAQLAAGVMLPCNVIVYEDDDRQAVVVAVDPTQGPAALHPDLAELAGEVRAKLERVLASLPA